MRRGPYRGDLVGFLIDRDLAEDQPLLAAPGADHVQRRAGRGAVERAPQGLAIDRDHPLMSLGETPHEGLETLAELLRVQEPKDAAERVV